MASLRKTSRCLDDVASAGDAAPGRFLPENEANELHRALREKLNKGPELVWEQHKGMTMPVERALAAVEAWPGARCRVLFLDLTDPRVLELDKERLREFARRWVHSLEETYFLPESGDELVCLDHNELGHRFQIS